MAHHITVNIGSNDNPSGDGFNFTASGPDSLIVDANAFLISRSDGTGATLKGLWTVTINGEVGTFDGLSKGLNVVGGITDVTNITVGSNGDVFGLLGVGLFGAGGNVTNRGTISGIGDTGLFGASNAFVTINNSGLIQGWDGLDLGRCIIINRGTIRGTHEAIITSGITDLTNSGKIEGDVRFGIGTDTFTDFKKVGHVIKSGTVSGVIDLGGGDDHFNGGNNNEKVQDGVGNDTYNFGGGNDYYIATPASGVSADDIVNGGKGIDTYDASGAINSVSVSFNLRQAFGAFSQIGNDTITGFETVIGGAGEDFFSGDGAANTFIGGAGHDQLTGFGGRDILTGGADDDTFIFTKLGDTGTKASTRDVITDFVGGGQDLIDLSAIDANGKLAGDPVFNFIGRANFSHTAGQLRESFSGGDTIVSGDVNGDGKADFSILLKGHVLLFDFDIVL